MGRTYANTTWTGPPLRREPGEGPGDGAGEGDAEGPEEPRGAAEFLGAAGQNAKCTLDCAVRVSSAVTLPESSSGSTFSGHRAAGGTRRAKPLLFSGLARMCTRGIEK